MEDQDLDSIYNYITGISNDINATAVNTRSDFVWDGFNIMAIAALVLSMIATFVAVKQWWATKKVNSSLNKTLAVSKIAFKDYLPGLIKELYLSKVKALASCLFILKHKDDKGGKKLIVEEWMLEKGQYNSKVADQMVALYPKDDILFRAVENLKRQFLIINEMVVMVRQHLINLSIDDTSKVNEIIDMAAGYFEVGVFIRKVLDRYNEVDTRKMNDNYAIDCIIKELDACKIIMNAQNADKDNYSVYSDPNMKDLVNLAEELCNKDRAKSSFMYDIYGVEKMKKMLVEHICKYYPYVSYFEVNVKA